MSRGNRGCLSEFVYVVKVLPGLDNVDNKTTIYYLDGTYDAEPFYPAQDEVRLWKLFGCLLKNALIRFIQGQY